MTIESLERYSRQVVIPEIGETGQRKIANAKVLLIGAGGLGSPTAFYLAAAGVGVIGIVDGDTIELSNLNRQILHDPSRIDALKAISAKQTLEKFNPSIEIIVYPSRYKTTHDLYEIINRYDLVIDCTDNYPTRFAINAACIQACKPWVYGAVSGFEGQTMTIIPGQGPCYCCLYPSIPPAVKAAKLPGVIGVTPGITGIIQATEALKCLIGIGSLLIGKLLVIDLLEMTMSKLTVIKNPDCRDCK